MSASKRSGKPRRASKLSPITAHEAIQILQTAIGYCQSAGLTVQAQNNGTALVLTIPRVRYIVTNNGTSAEFRLTDNGTSNNEQGQGVSSAPNEKGDTWTSKSER